MLATKSNAGFVLPVVLGIVLLAGLLAVQAGLESGSTVLLATQRQLHQRSFELAESGIDAAMRELAAGAEPARHQTLRPTVASADAALVETALQSRSALADGFSANRVVESTYEIRSTGQGTRGSSVTVVQGVRQHRVAESP